MPGVRSMTVFTLPGIPEVQAGDDLAALIADALEAAGETLEPGDIIVAAQKIVSKAEGRYIELADMTPDDEALEWAAKTEKDPRLVQAILDETEKVLRWRPNLLVVEHKRGWVMANAGADQSNIEGAEGRTCADAAAGPRRVCCRHPFWSRSPLRWPCGRYHCR